VREESRLKALIEEQYLRLDTRRKAFMDAIRISCRGIFFKLAMEFRPLYNNYRDDHFIVRELTRASGIIEKRDGIVNILLIPTMEFQPATRIIVLTFLERISRQINDHSGAQYMLIRMQLLNEDSNDNDLNIDQQAVLDHCLLVSLDHASHGVDEKFPRLERSAHEGGFYPSAGEP